MSLLNYAIAWAVLTLVVIMLAIYRYSVARKEDGMVHIADSEAQMVTEQSSIARKLTTIDRWGKSLTVLDVVFGLALLSMYLYSVWNELNNLKY